MPRPSSANCSSATSLVMPARCALASRAWSCPRRPRSPITRTIGPIFNTGAVWRPRRSSPRRQPRHQYLCKHAEDTGPRTDLLLHVDVGPEVEIFRWFRAAAGYDLTSLGSDDQNAFTVYANSGISPVIGNYGYVNHEVYVRLTFVYSQAVSRNGFAAIAAVVSLGPAPTRA